VAGWGFSPKLWGFGSFETAAEKEAARQIITAKGEVMCTPCGVSLTAFKSTVAAHVAKPPQTCLVARATHDKLLKRALDFNARRNADIAAGNVPEGPEKLLPRPTVAWEPKRIMLSSCTYTARSKDEQQTPDSDTSKALLSAIFASHDISFNAQSILFAGKSDVLSALRLLPPGDGLGGYKKVAETVGLGVDETSPCESIRMTDCCESPASGGIESGATMNAARGGSPPSTDTNCRFARPRPYPIILPAPSYKNEG
jgi:hypothetical protein